MAIAKLSLTIGDRTETSYIPLSDEYDNNLSDALILSLMGQVLPQLFYTCVGDVEADLGTDDYSPYPSRQHQGLTRCPKCNGDYYGNLDYCPHCGARRADPYTPS